MIGPLAAGRAGWGRLAPRHPAWWALALPVAAWVALLLAPWHAADAPAHAHHGDHAGGAFPLGMELAAWALMVVAMMVPLMTGPLIAVGARSLRARRDRAQAGFLGGYLAAWLLAGATVLGVLALTGAGGWLRSPGAILAAFALAAAWQVGPVHRRALRACHRTFPLPPRGWRADRACLRWGWWAGSRCVWSCGPAMLACVVAGHAPVAMIAATAVAIDERRGPRPRQRRAALALAVTGILVALLAA